MSGNTKRKPRRVTTRHDPGPFEDPTTADIRTVRLPPSDDAQTNPPDDQSRGSVSGETDRLRFYLYTVEGTIHGERRTFGVVCCHASDALALIVRQLPDIDNLTVTRGGPVHYIAIGDHPLRQ